VENTTPIPAIAEKLLRIEAFGTTDLDESTSVQLEEHGLDDRLPEWVH